MLVDFERAWLDLKAELDGKQGIGVDRLLALMARLEARHRLDESLAEEALRLYGVQLSQDLRALARGDHVTLTVTAPTPDAWASPRVGMASPSHPTIQEDLDDRSPEAHAGSRG